MKAWLKRHRWNVINVLGVVLIIWVGPYLKWRMSSKTVDSSRLILVPPSFPNEFVYVFRPLAMIDSWISGDRVQLFTWGDGF